MSSIWQTIELVSGELKLVCLPGIGGRLWDVVFHGRSLLFQNPDLVDIIPDLDRLDELPTRSPQFKFPLWGGEKTWIAPDSSWPADGPHPVLDSGPYQILSQDNEHVRLQSEICPHSGLQIERTIALDGNSSFMIDHKLTNRGTEASNVGIWSVMMLKRPALIALRCPNASEPFSIVFGDPTTYVTVDQDRLVHQCDNAVEFKTGAKNIEGEVEINFGLKSADGRIVCTTAPALPSDQFAHGHDFEVFNSKDYDYCEAEWHSPARTLQPGANIGLQQKFELGLGAKNGSKGGTNARNGK